MHTPIATFPAKMKNEKSPQTAPVNLGALGNLGTKNHPKPRCAPRYIRVLSGVFQAHFRYIWVLPGARQACPSPPFLLSTVYRLPHIGTSTDRCASPHTPLRIYPPLPPRPLARRPPS
jgi:hypothetical protein